MPITQNSTHIKPRNLKPHTLKPNQQKAKRKKIEAKLETKHTRENNNHLLSTQHMLFETFSLYM